MEESSWQTFEDIEKEVVRIEKKTEALQEGDDEGGMNNFILLFRALLAERKGMAPPEGTEVYLQQAKYLEAWLRFLEAHGHAVESVLRLINFQETLLETRRIYEYCRIDLMSDPPELADRKSELSRKGSSIRAMTTKLINHELKQLSQLMRDDGIDPSQFFD